MLRVIALASAFLATPAPPAPPSADPMAGRYGNTQKITHKDGRVMRALFNQDKSATVMRPDGSVMQATWEIEGDKLCLSISMLVVSAKRCMPFVPDKKPGDSWSQKGPDGDDVTVTIVPGRP